MHDDVRWGFGVPTPTMRWSDFSGLLHLIPVLKLKLSGYSSSFQPRVEVFRFVTLVNFPFKFYSKAFATVNTVSATVWYLLRTECRPTLHVARRMPDEEGTDSSSVITESCYDRPHVYMFIEHACFSSFNARRCQPTGPLYTESFVFRPKYVRLTSTFENHVDPHCPSVSPPPPPL